MTLLRVYPSTHTHTGHSLRCRILPQARNEWMNYLTCSCSNVNKSEARAGRGWEGGSVPSKKSCAQATSTAWKQSLTTATDEVCSWRSMSCSGPYLFKKGGRGWRDTCHFPSWKAGMVSCTRTRARMPLHYNSMEGRCTTTRRRYWQVPRTEASCMFARSWAAGVRGAWARVIGIVPAKSWNFWSAQFFGALFIRRDN